MAILSFSGIEGIIFTKVHMIEVLSYTFPKKVTV